MTAKTTKFSDDVGIAAVLDPESQAAGTRETAWIDMATFAEVMAVLSHRRNLGVGHG